MASVGNQPSGSVCISSAEYCRLVEISYQYAHLRQNLLRGGVDENTIAILSVDESTLARGQDSTLLQNTHDGYPPPTSKPETPIKTSNVFMSYLERTNQSQVDTNVRQQRRSDWSDVDAPSDDVSASIDTSGGVPIKDTSIVTTVPSVPRLEKNATRTIQLTGLGDGVTHADITAAIRGGQLLDVYCRTRDRIASVSFVYAEDAKAFFARARHSDLYIRGRRVDLKWSERQYVIGNHLVNRLRAGASRNLVIRSFDPNHTEESIREDLEHIHNLIVIKVNFFRGDCYIETNSVDKAVLAKSCMLSRLKYKGQKIDFREDDCSQPLAGVEVSPMPVKERANVRSTHSMNHLVNSNNPFEVLSMFYPKGQEDFYDIHDSDDSNDTLQ
ncbi:hypothetical protein B0T10DRAFT_560849 [Thelonectria olida]|uniref:Negative regulator of differentiation 1 n=1 Tax=Thelonectria olida TaxID=1576542 RepID=A0A9P8W8M1_9HYPO|nr:hypothetical protein B0T10DRAFT_560849 [Thelonectria olida]